MRAKGGGQARPGPVRRLYHWVTGWAETRFGIPALATVSFAESSIFPIPPDPLLIALCLGATRYSLVFAAVATLASVLGGAVGYWIGAVILAGVTPSPTRYSPSPPASSR